ncbi:MAG: tyrosine--tRNA ligase [Actinomycetota bacterium]|nr:tyrosine--tRNA ligase [Actinomycetota bacterium]
MDTPQTVLERLQRTTDQILGREDLITRLSSGRRLRIKFGVDCTAPELHLGHAVNLWMMRYLQDLGHTVVFLLGDTTTRIGDPTGRSTTRPVLTTEEIEGNAAAFLKQVTIVLRDDPQVFEVRRNSEWYERMTINDLVSELSLVTHAQLMSRDMFQARVAQHQDIGMHELIYPVLQGYDSVALESDLTIVGSDQLFNEAMGRTFQAKHGQLPQTVITSTITPGLDGGPKQSKSLNNYVGLSHSPQDQFGRLMTLDDQLMGVWATAYTELPPEQVDEFERLGLAGGKHARDAKLDLAEAIVSRYHGQATAGQVRESFLRVFSQRNLPDDIPDLALIGPPRNVLELVGAARPDLTHSAARRLINEGGVRLDHEQLLDPFDDVDPSSGQVLQAGRRRWFRIQKEAQTS